jgi:hypothetical protein
VVVTTRQCRSSTTVLPKSRSDIFTSIAHSRCLVFGLPMYEILYIIVLILYLCLFSSCYRVRTLLEPSIELRDIEVGLQPLEEDEDKDRDDE